MKRKQFGFLLVCLLGAAAVANVRADAAERRVKGSGVVKSVPHPISGVRQISVHGVGTLVVEVGDTESLTIEADDNLLQYIEVKQEGDKWDIGPVSDVSLEPRTPIRYRLRVKQLDAVALSGATRAELKALPTIPEFDLSLSGATSARLDGISAEVLKVNASGASRIEINAGSAKRQSVHLSGASRYNAFGLRSETADIHGSGTSSVELTATRTLNVSASGVAQVRYKGAPPSVKSDTSGVASVKAAR